MAGQTYELVGHPVKHSLSPAMQNAAFKACGIDAQYRLHDVPEGDLEGFLAGLSGSGISGLNVTIPHKIKTRVFLEREGTLDDNAERLGAVNTVKVTPEGLFGYNTDGPGFYRSLVEDLKFEPESKRVFVLGAGGAATAVVMYLGNGPKQITVSDVDALKLRDLSDRFKRYFDPKKLKTVSTDDIPDQIKNADLLVNATPVGMRDGDPSPVDKTLLRAGLRVYDLVYNRPYTQLVKDANSAKCHAVTGLGMLLYQGAIAFEIWTGKKAPVAEMKKALKLSLEDTK